MGCQAVLDCRGFLFQCALGPALVLVDEERAALDVAVLAHSDQDGLACLVLKHKPKSDHSGILETLEYY